MAYISFKPTDYYNTIVWTGDGGAAQAQTGVGFQPDMTWIKCRNQAENHGLYDSVRGVTKNIATNLNAIESTISGVTAFSADGFSVGASGITGYNTQTYVGFNWKAGTTSGLSGGTITPSAYSFDTTAKISIVKYTGNGTSGATVPHGLGVKPAAMFVKNTSGSVNSWAVYHRTLTATSYLELDVTNSVASNAGRWNNTEPTTSLFSLGDSDTTNGSGNDYIAYLFGQVPGFSQFSSYTGSGNTNGPFVYCGFQPAWIMIKETDSSSGWCMYDNLRSDSNPGYWNINSNFLQANDTGPESVNGNLKLDITGTGFKVRNSAGDINGAANNYVVFAFASNPVVSSNGKAGTGR